MPRTKAGFNFDGSLSFFDRVVFPAAAQAQAGQLNRMLGGNIPQTVVNPNFQGSEIDRQQQSAAIQDRQVQNFDRRMAAARGIENIQNQLLGRPAQTGPGAVQQAQRTVTGVPGMSDDPVGVSRSTNPAGSLEVQNPFAQRTSLGGLVDKAVGVFTSPQQQRFAQDVQARSQANTSKAAQAWVAMGTAAGKGLPPWRLRQAQEEFARQYPDFAQMNPLRALTPAEGKKITDTIELQERQQDADRRAAEAGIQSAKLIRNEKGIIQVDPSWTEHVKAERSANIERAKAAEEDRSKRERQFRDAVGTRRELLEQFNRNVKNPYDATEQREDWFGFEQMREEKIRSFGDYEQEQRKRFFPEEFAAEPEPLQTVGRKQLASARKIAQEMGIQNVVVDQADFDALQAQANSTGTVVDGFDAETNEPFSVQPQKR